jgi:hypothetical protein
MPRHVRAANLGINLEAATTTTFLCSHFKALCEHELAIVELHSKERSHNGKSHSSVRHLQQNLTTTLIMYSW